jgi:pyruvate,orthophosphate dikinase
MHSTKTSDGKISRVFLFPEAHAAFKSAESSKLSPAARETAKAILGGKGAGLMEMTASGVRVPPGLTITTRACRGLFKQVLTKLAAIEKTLNRRLGDKSDPLLLSVRSGAKFSMPGMMDTVLNLGMNDEIVVGLAERSGNERLAWDNYRRFIAMFGNVVLDVSKEKFEHLDTEMTVANLKELVKRFKDLVKAETGKDFPTDTREQLRDAIEAVFRSWNNPRAIYYRNLNKIDHDLGTAVTVQAMVFGNRDNRSATGVCFTRNPSTGEKKLYGEYLINAQGEDVVAGVRTPNKIDKMADELPEAHAALVKTAAMLEDYYGDMQDIEFTIESDVVYILQTRTGKRTAEAAVRVAVEMAEEGILSRVDALQRVEPLQLNQLLLPSFQGPQARESAG